MPPHLKRPKTERQSKRLIDGEAYQPTLSFD